MKLPEITRKKTRPARVGNVTIGGDAPVSVQSMTNTRTADADATLRQIDALVAAGADLVRLAVP
ncbi:MAG: 4-hydroxy-3-methylbut-2-en-1-yl diphosphate synthase, partial [Planctomycetaceae bacterium]